MLIKENTTVLFQGDSITDCGRGYDDDANLGSGYPNMVAAWFNAMYPQHKVKFINRGISGNRAKDLKDRWSQDCIELKPDYVSILIGVNDCWRRYDSNDRTTAEDFKRDYNNILTQVREKTNASIILCEPFVLPFPQDRKQWREDLDPKIQAVRELALKFNVLYIPYDGIFAQACCLREPEFWSADGVHPTPAGHALMARNWLMSVGAL